MENLQSTIQQTAQEMQQTIVRTVETQPEGAGEKGYGDTVQSDHLRAFPAPSRPSSWPTRRERDTGKL